ncbi:pyridoxamine 5'-phosphate oxidase family protein [Brachybacterium halotolerans subsp. kimchii]|uniref:pyridoxine/pyridoxamine 5'-phosphate oxidase n=1 Tax=Brachybacterium halotolerans TaxID=2795215 RepID=UPI001E49707B|nr:pyridoxamine 5'-phosphate oxidase family protein [Brachybacterium halotolerans]UEJ81288.1 pyridoxamine 5'-phosphate oxidase family protein [Brachybacterium halotolerans subsp. kimchii]
MTELRDRLRKLPAFPSDLPVLDPDSVPEDPEALFRDWLEEAIASGARQPHAMTFTTVDEAGFPVGRTLILKDIEDGAYQVSTHRTSRKGAQLEQDAKASMIFFWRESGRQVRITGTVIALDDEASQADWASRPSFTGEPNPDWQVYALVPSAFEFMQAREDRQHTRIEYTVQGQGRAQADPDAAAPSSAAARTWTHGPVPTPAG